MTDTTLNAAEELLSQDGVQTATIQEYVAAAKLLTTLREYRIKVAQATEALGAPGFMDDWPGWDGHAIFDLLRHVDDEARGLAALLHRIDLALAASQWPFIEQTVKRSAVRHERPGGAVLCVLDADGEWIEKGKGQLMQGTRAELTAARERWTALDDVLPPPFPSEVARRYGPGVA